jgi:hypothetical protein
VAILGIKGIAAAFPVAPAAAKMASALEGLTPS